MREKGLMKNNFYIAKRSPLIDLFYLPNRDFIIFYKKGYIQLSTMEKSTKEVIKNMSQSIILECCICYETGCKYTGCSQCTASFCYPCAFKLLNDSNEFFCPCCKIFIMSYE